MTIVTSAEKFTEKDIARFWKKVDRSAGDAGCWLWTGKPNHSGYGTIEIKVKESRHSSLLAHRVSWMLKNGEILDNLKVLHRCDCPPCVNPKHLFLGTQEQNIADMVAKGRQHKGSRVKLAKLTEEQVLLIKSAIGSKPEAEIAREFNVSPNAIRDIASGNTWKHVGEDVSSRARFGAKKKILSEEKVREIRAFASEFSIKEAAKKYNMKYKIAWQIVSGRSYKNII